MSTTASSFPPNRSYEPVLKISDAIYVHVTSAVDPMVWIVTRILAVNQLCNYINDLEKDDGHQINLLLSSLAYLTTELKAVALYCYEEDLLV